MPQLVTGTAYSLFYATFWGAVGLVAAGAVISWAKAMASLEDALRRSQ
jgi:hypothetical protein